MAETEAPKPEGRGRVPAFTEDPWTRVMSVHGLPGDELRSALQKSIRRGLLENALLVGYELFQTGPEAERLLWERLQIISVEDVGFGRADAPILLDALHRMHEQFAWPGGERFLFAAHAIRLLATSPKDRTTDELVNWISHLADDEGLRPEIMDVALDVHTRRGQLMGRGLRHFLGEGALVENEMPDRDLTYRRRLLALHGITGEGA
ncbi:MAG: AAA family ATPase [Acidimicrobiales bacterium]